MELREPDIWTHGIALLGMYDMDQALRWRLESLQNKVPSQGTPRESTRWLEAKIGIMAGSHDTRAQCGHDRLTPVIRQPLFAVPVS